MLFVLTPTQLLKKIEKSGVAEPENFAALKSGARRGRAVYKRHNSQCLCSVRLGAAISIRNIREPSDRHRLSAARIRPKVSSPFNEGGNSCGASELLHAYR
jgi:hypothetical protein